MDSDEEFIDNETLTKRFNVFKENPDCHLILADKLIVPEEYAKEHISSLYANAIGDPFTYFIYKPKTTTLTSFKYNIRETNNDVA